MRNWLSLPRRGAGWSKIGARLGGAVQVRPVRGRWIAAAIEMRRLTGRSEQPLSRRATADGAEPGTVDHARPFPRRRVERDPRHRRSAQPVHRQPATDARGRCEQAALHRDRSEAWLPLYRTGRGTAVATAPRTADHFPARLAGRTIARSASTLG